MHQWFSAAPVIWITTTPSWISRARLRSLRHVDYLWITLQPSPAGISCRVFEMSSRGLPSLTLLFSLSLSPLSANAFATKRTSGGMPRACGRPPRRPSGVPAAAAARESRNSASWSVGLGRVAWSGTKFQALKKGISFSGGVSGQALPRLGQTLTAAASSPCHATPGSLTRIIAKPLRRSFPPGPCALPCILPSGPRG